MRVVDGVGGVEPTLVQSVSAERVGGGRRSVFSFDCFFSLKVNFNTLLMLMAR